MPSGCAEGRRVVLFMYLNSGSISKIFGLNFNKKLDSFFLCAPLRLSVSLLLFNPVFVVVFDTLS